MCKRVLCLLIVLVCLPGLFLADANAETAPAFAMDAGMPADGKITITLSGRSIVDMYGYEARFTYDSDKLEWVEFKSGRDGFSVSPIIKDNEIIIAHTKIGSVPGDSGDLTIGTLTFKRKKYGKADVKWESMKTVAGNLKSKTSAVGASVSIGNTFVDLAGHWAKEDIELLASRGIIDGMDDTHFVPEGKVTRGQFAAMIARAFHLKETSAQSPFTDVQPDSWYAKVINEAHAAGIVQGITADRFAPEQDISREEMTVMLVRAGKFVSEGKFKGTGTASNAAPQQIFADERSISEWAIEDVALAVRAGIINGRTEDTFVPQGQASRAEAGVVVKRLLFALGQL
ncbi:S-layer homology domain-containing protein [Paenibacillus contaminans]|uniref:S-layer homology domain-containing protein n=1 Tax=Paenibacillus contaminans TaxID=450362 RepID=UPI0013148A05|nr:S-layer homology domain-containing protein [Paenibacillus contaminans]